jgi:stage III sporulation protein AA
MKKTEEKPRALSVIELLPVEIGSEILRLASCRPRAASGIKEISLRVGGACYLKIDREDIRLFSKVDRGEMDAIVTRITDGALYAHRDSIAEGFISLERGIRVGVCGSASYDGGGLVGIKKVTSLIFRIPTGECEFSEELYDIFSSGIGRGAIIYSPPGVGKTTAIRRLAYMFGGGNLQKRVAVVDERGEFDEFDYHGCQVDILKGYKKKTGIEIATRTLSPELIMIDEIGAEDSEAILSVVRCGIPIVATAHAGSKEELMSRPALRGLFDASVFGIAVGIFIKEGKYLLSAEEI